MKKRVVALCLATVMTVGLLTGSKAKDESQKTGTEVTNDKDNKSDVGEKEPTNTATPATDEKTVTVKWCVFGDKAQDHDLVMKDLNAKLKEKINVELDLEVIPQGEYNDKMKLASTGGENFDLVFTASWLNNYDENMSRDAFMPLNKLMDEYGKDMQASIPEWLLDVAKVNGELYAIPNQQIIARQLGVVIQKEYADKYGFNKTSLKDIRELEPFFDEIVKNEPSLFPVDIRVEAVTEKTYEGLAADSAFIRKDDPNATLIPATEVIADQLKLDNEWYQKGYIRKDIATVTDNSADVKANRYVCTLSSYKPGWGAEFTSRQGVEYIAVPIEGAYIKAISGIETMTAINVNSKNPEAAMKLLNLVYTDKEIFNELLFGLEGTHYTKTGENFAEPVADSKYNYSAYAWRVGNQFNAWYLPGQVDGTWEETDKLNNTAQVSVLRGFTFSPANVQAELAQVAAVKKEYKNAQYTTKDIDAYITEYTDKLNQAGLPNIVKELQTQIDAWKNK